MKKSKNIEAGGVTYANVGINETTYGMTKFQGKQGHGFAAERAEHINDLYHGKNASILGDNNAKDGADRLVNGVEIQSKYCRSGSACIHECFKEGKYRYYSKNGEPMQVEVPSDMYDDAVKAMKRRIQNNEVKGTTNPDDAEKLVKKGHYTYSQVKQIAQAGTIESIKFDAANGVIIAKNVMGISAIITFATSIWNGESIDIALENAVLSGLKVGGVSFLTTVISSQIARTSVSTSIRGGTDFLVSKLGPKATSYIANSLRNGTNIYGAAAMNNVSKLLSGNIVASAVSLVILSAGDIVDIFRGRISKKQLAKNMTIAGATIVGGSVGWVAGNVIGGAVGGTLGGVATAGAGTVTSAQVGSKIGGFIGSAIGGTTAGGVTHGAMDMILEDDAIQIMRLVEQEFISICEQYILTENEVYSCLSLLKEKLTKKELKNIYANNNRSEYIRKLIIESVKPIVARRKFILNPNESLVLDSMKMLINDAINGSGIFGEISSELSSEEIKESVIKNRNIKEDQIGQLMQPVLRMNRNQLKVERTLNKAKKSNEDAIYKEIQILDERQGLKAELNSLLE